MSSPVLPPLTGLRILIPRSAESAHVTAREVRRRGGVPVVLPLITSAPPADTAPLTAAIERWHRGAYAWLAVTSAAGAAALRAARVRPVAGSRIAAVGPATAQALVEAGLTPDLIPPHEYTGRGLGEALSATLSADPSTGAPQSTDSRSGTTAEPPRVLLPVAAGAGHDFERALAAAGERADRVTAYRTVPTERHAGAERAALDSGIDAILVTSGSVARELAVRCQPLPPAARIVAIGPPTARALAELGIRPHLVATSHTVPGMLNALAAAVDASAATPTVHTPPHSTAPDSSGAHA
ncbi:uroporphyrinogen-III synthase [Leucobacter chromiireducens]|uniref:Uroporphyrinogen-III synthase n=1 Tax=Leucobacter chromiireducens subsp. chromiireducens TaxID=660067 RepID=A0ABS1SM44_9MICO|nr:uroporphyrinogen-III synthase [Leucobacter chromiireducens]MBL3689205.1 uroporphyrinogen-III synthase [Leucobacter chromiireducens subsp. chromiireducens]